MSQPKILSGREVGRIIVAAVMGCWIHAVIASAQSPQESSGEKSAVLSSPGPYRRVFVRDSDLPLDGYRAMDLESFSSLLEEQKKRAVSLDPNSPNHETELRSFQAQVRLVGADLVSERSRLRWNWKSSSQRNRGEVRKLIAPWNAAIDMPARLGSIPSQNLSLAPAWMYDSNGLPLIRVASEEEWFSWTLRPLSNSTPNRLSYALSFPRTVDSCLVLQLPKSARIADANIVVRPVANWNEVTERIGDWPVALAAADSIPELNGTDSFWLLELSGRDQASFSILLNPSRVIYDNLNSDDRPLASWNRLIARQATAHTISLNQIKTVSEWEWYETNTLDRAFRIRVPEGMRVRNLKLNERETVPRFSDRVLELTVPTEEGGSNTSTGNASRNKVSVEFLSAASDLGPDANGIVKIPPIECLNGYVVSGTTSIAADVSIELRNIHGSTGRLDTIRTSDKSIDRMDFSWFQAPPEISFSLAKRIAIDSAEILTRLSTDSNRVVAFVKMQLSPWHASAPGNIRIGSGWSLETMQINHRGLDLFIEEPGPGISSTSLQINPTGPIDDGPVQLELQLTRDIAEAFSDNTRSEDLIALPQRKTSQALVIEPGYASQLEYYGDFYRDLCDEETLTSWQRDRLPRLGRFLLFRMPEGRLPKLRPKEESPLIQCSIATQVSDDGDRVRVSHVLDLQPGISTTPNIEIQLPGIWRWEWESPDGWKVFDAKTGSASDSWLWNAAVSGSSGTKPATEPSNRFRIRASANHDKKSETWQLSLPRLSSDQPISYSLQTDPNFQVIPDQPRGAWEFDIDGRWIMRWQESALNASLPTIAIREIDPGNLHRWWIAESHLHLAIDTLGQQRAVLALDARGLRNTPWEFSVAIPDDWSIERVIDETAEASAREDRNSFAIRREGSNCKIIRQPATPTREALASEIRVVMSGPRLKPQSFMEWGILPTHAIIFSWPDIRLDAIYPKPARSLWTPVPLVVSGPPSKRFVWNHQTEASLPPTVGIWSPWRWTAEATSWLGGYSNESDGLSESFQRTVPSPSPPRELVPGWALADWKQSYPSEQSLMDDGSPSDTFALRYATSPNGPALWLVIAILFAYGLLPRAPWLCLLLASTCAIGGHWLPDPCAIWFRSTWVGLSIGALVYSIRWTVKSPGLRPVDRDRPEPWHPWNEPGLSNDGLSDASGRPVVISSVVLILSLAMGLPMLAQDPASSARPNREPIFDVLIPLTEEGAPSGDVVYVPSSIVTTEEVSPSISLASDRDSHVIAARHSLRFDARSISFGNTEQPCNHIYEVWVGESGVGKPWRIPFSSDRSRLSRFLIDGLEVASNRLARGDTELVWYPDRMGRRVLQIESQVRVRPSERDRNESDSVEGIGGESRSPRAWVVDVPILPAGNAVLDVETDAGWSIDFNRRGRFSNPSIGKFSIQLGNQDRLEGEIAPDTAPNIPGGGLVANDSGTLGSSESPQMNTELFIDRGQLLARTIVEYPRAIDAPEEIELESDMQWQPIGNLWGEAKLIDIRPGSTLDRRRYIVRWIPETASSPGKRLITTTWIPIGNANLRNILFAECRDRRVRPNTLRYARSAGSSWMLEGINTWVPSINTKERIEWLELNERPIATSLRIPLNGGFGVLRQQSDTKLQRARVTHQVGVGSAKISLRSRIEFANAINNRRSLIVAIPSQYSVVEVLSRNTLLPHIEWLTANRRFIQVFGDRETGDVSELVVIAEQDVSQADTLNAAIPVLTMEGASIAEQFAEISADPAWRIRIPSHAGQAELEIMRGRGLGKPLASMSLQESSESFTVAIDRWKGEWQGDLSARILTVSDNDVRWELRMSDNHSKDAKPTLAVSLPNELSRAWKSDAVIKELPSLDPARRWLQIQPVWGDEQQNASFAVEWVADPKALQDDRWLDRLRFESDPQLKCQLEVEEKNMSLAKGPQAEATGAEVSDASNNRSQESIPGLEVHRILEAQRDSGRISMFSSWWIDLGAEGHGGESGLQWVLPDGVRVHWVSINGAGAYWRTEGVKLTVVLPPSTIPVRIDLWTDCDRSVHSLLEDTSALDAVLLQKTIPTLEDTAGQHRQRRVISQDRIYDMEGHPSGSRIELGREICRRNIECLDALNRLQPRSESSSMENEGTWYRWRDYLMKESESMLLAWTQYGRSSDSSDHTAMVTAFLGAASLLDSQTPRTVGSDSEQLNESFDANLFRTAGTLSDGDSTDRGDGFAWNRVMATLSMGLLVVFAPWIWLSFGRPMQRKAWWPLILIGAGIWLVTGTWLPGLALMLLALILAIDSYLILNERFRQSGTRVPR